jgi:hypothetical protein
MLLLIGWFLLSIAVAILASNRGRSGGAWFLVSILLSPLISVIFLLVSKDLSKEDGQRVACPKCAEKILITANICPYCKTEVSKDVEFLQQVNELKVKPKEDRTNLLIGIGAIVAIILIAKIIDGI